MFYGCFTVTCEIGREFVRIMRYFSVLHCLSPIQSVVLNPESSFLFIV